MQKKIAVVRARFNELATKKMLEGALATLNTAGVAAEDIDIFEVPGCFELPVIVSHAAQSGRYHGVLALGCVIRGETPHFDFVAGEASRGLMDISLKTGTPIGFGVLTTDTIEQALNRCGLKGGNKGADSADALLQCLATLDQLRTKV